MGTRLEVAAAFQVELRPFRFDVFVRVMVTGHFLD